MPSSLIFAALAVAWLVVLVPMVARRRQEVNRTADSALAARVLRRGGRQPGAPPSNAEEGFAMPDPEHIEPIEDDERIDLVEEAEPRRYRPGRGGFDPELAAALAREKYQFRQRVVLVMLLLALATGVLAFIAVPMLWWVHGAIDLALVGYLTYLRRQVRIEEEIRQRRMARMAGGRRRTTGRAHPAAPPAEHPADDAEPAPPPRTPHPGATIVEIDDEDPEFDELDRPQPLSFRRASGE
ncbi:hypothetical protein GCM10012275_59640 [Longimycelium tulufanense]|uniref:Transmembrane protein n=1 Tax=Longimycelium tulufanense TaxID=907463 RepID=A0A8J3CL49_9PSEU|nr:gephyrin-like molybdotransferase receptor GlpR [Longimycelium tulufanense]GGM81061.1 hypothetical protein GCM10012275_59640 [Longimycelium tulufanense]